MLFNVTKPWSQQKSQEERHCQSHLFMFHEGHHVITRLGIVILLIIMQDTRESPSTSTRFTGQQATSIHEL